MKKQFVSNSTKQTLARLGLAALLLTGTVAQTFAQTPQKDDPFVNVKYVGNADQKVQFQVDMVADNDEAYILSVQEQDGTVLYKERVAKKLFTKQFAWSNDDLNSSKLLFVVTGERSKKTQVFEVASQIRTVQDVVVTKR
jgi:hypothetical protein